MSKYSQILKATIVGLLLALSVGSKAQTITLDSTTLVVDTLITGLNVPWEILWGPDDHIWMTERDGKVSRVDPQTGTRTVILDISSANGGPVHQVSESGLLGMALHPDFPDSNYVYLVYTYRPASAILERMVRYQYNGSALVNPQTFIENIPGNGTHNGSRLVFGPDRKLYMTTGDAQNQPSSQNISSLNGKTLRFNLDGSIPSDNPIAGSYVYSWGHRNHQGLVFGPTGILYSSEHGPNTDDELNIIYPARNHGWPTVNGFCNTPTEITFCADSNVVEPLVAWTPTIAPSDLIYYDHPSIPEWQGTLIMTVLKDKYFVVFNLNAAGDEVTSQTNYLVNQKGRLRDICAAPDGTIYIATNGANWSNTDPNTHSIIRIKNPSYAEPLVVDAGQDLSVCAGSGVQLIPTITGGATPYTYSWTPANELSCSVCSSPLIVSLTNTTDFILTVTDSNGTSVSDTVTVNVVAQPGVPSYELTFIDSFWGVASFDILAPAADSVMVVIESGDTDTFYSMTQAFTITDSLQIFITPADPPLGYRGTTYNICIYSYSSCGTSFACDTQTIILDESSGIGNTAQSTFTLFPNPTTGAITLSGLQTVDRITVMDALGAVITEVDQPLLNGSDFTLNLSHLQPGIYFIGVEQNGATGVRKLIKY